MIVPLSSAEPVWLRRTARGLSLHVRATICGLLLLGAVIGLRFAVAQLDRRIADVQANPFRGLNPQPSDPDAPLQRGQIQIISLEGEKKTAVTIDTRGAAAVLQETNDELERVLRFGRIVKWAAYGSLFAAIVMLSLWLVSVFLMTSGERGEGRSRRRGRSLARGAAITMLAAGFCSAWLEPDSAGGLFAAIVAFGAGAVLARGLERTLTSVAERLPDMPLHDRLKANLEATAHFEIVGMVLLALYGFVRGGEMDSIVLGLLLGNAVLILLEVVQYVRLVRRQAHEVAAVAGAARV